MIYTVTLNPSVDYIVKVANFEVGKLNRSTSDLKLPGGKGINVSRVLKRLGIESKALGFVGGFTGEFTETFLKQEEIQVDFVKLNEDTRINIKMKTEEETEINGAGPAIKEVEYQLFLSKLNELTEEDIIVFSGSIPGSLPATLYKDLIDFCNEKKIRVVADVSEEALKNVIHSKPFLIKPNHHELGDLFNVKIHEISEAEKYGRKLLDYGIENVIVSMADKGALLINKDGSIYANSPNGKLKNSVGAGDSLVAGFLSGLATSQTLNNSFRIGVASGSATAFSMELCKKSEVMNLLDQIKTTNL